jgi:CheY-like chemotaxis protein
MMLAGENFTVRTAASARIALEALSMSVPDAMLTDIQMPEMDGLELIRQVRLNPRTKGIAIFAVTANAMKENVQEAYAAGCDGYITKPLDTRTFGGWVREQLRRGRSGETAASPVTMASAEAFLTPVEFLLQSRDQMDRLVSTQRSGSREQACEALQQCAARAAVLGLPQIAAQARALEAGSFPMHEQEFIAGLRQLSDKLADKLAQLQLRETERAD